MNGIYIRRITLLFLICIMAHGCHKINYIYKDEGLKFSKDDFIESKFVGVAVIGEYAIDFYDVVQNDIQLYANPNELNIYDMSVNTLLNNDRTKILNIHDIKSACPEINYAIIVFVHKPILFKKYSKYPDEETYFSGDGSFKEGEFEYEKYSTKLTVKCEFLLFDILNNLLIAKSVDTFVETKKRVEKDDFSNKSYLGKIEDAIDMLKETGMMSTDDRKYPIINDVDPHLIDRYVYHFLKRTNVKP